ncbi:MAG TPA: methyltransferase [Verrucomicrobiales bacterium]|nr:methyltransferase [Verrucomicrobiales bacterium]
MFSKFFNWVRLVAQAVLTREPAQRHVRRYELLSALAARLGGFRLYTHSLIWWKDAAFQRLTQGYPGGQKINPRHYNLHQLARSVSDLPGDSVECGVYKGAGSYVIALAFEGKPGHLHHVFDSFEGLSAPVERDRPSDPTARPYESGEFATPEETVRRNLDRFGFIRFYKGWIPTRFPEVVDRRFAFVHIDVDLYEPTRDSIAFFYERLLPGGILVCDDYGFTDCPGAKRAFDEFIAGKPERHVIHLTSGQGMIVRRG